MPANGTGGGPPKGSPSDTPGPQMPLEEMANAWFGQARITTDDPAFQPPADPLDSQTPKATRLVYRDLPLVTVQNNWEPPEVRRALQSHMEGIFEMSGQLLDSVLGDDRIQSTLGSRSAGLFGREVIFKPANDSAAARECMDRWVEQWPHLATQASMQQLHATEILMGFSPGQVLWANTPQVSYAPRLRPWHPRYTYYLWPARRYVAMSQDGNLLIVPGNGKWINHTRWGEYRGWVRGAIRAVAEPWLGRHFAFRDFFRYSEKHGMPLVKARVPASSSEADRDRFEDQLSRLGQETTVMVQGGVTEGQGDEYDVSYVEATDPNWQSFPSLIDRCDMAIVLALLFQNLTTEVKGGSFAATTAHMDIRQNGIEADNEAWKLTIYEQIARPFAWLNFGDPDLAPWTCWDVTPKENLEHNAKQFQQFGTAVEVLRRGGIQFNDQDEVRKFARETFGLREIPEFSFKEPVSGGLGGSK